MEEGNPAPDFVYLDRLVKEYLTYREQPPVDDSPSELVEKIMKCFDNGDYPTILYLWDQCVAVKLSTKDSVDLHDASIAEYYMHIHCATNPFRQSTIANQSSPGEAAKLAARSMTIFRHFVESKGKKLSSTPEFHVSHVYMHRYIYSKLSSM